MAEIDPHAGNGHRSVCDHLVQVYRNRVDLAEAVAVFFSAGLSAGEAIIAVAMPAHWTAIADRLEKREHDLEQLRAEGRLVVADAEATLAAVSEDAGPSQQRFRSVIGDLLDAVAGGSPPRHIRVFGEMVDILCRRGDRAAADTLENYWNQLSRDRRFDLLCGYKLDVFDRDTQVNLLPQVYRAHTNVLPLANAEALDEAVQHALVEVLGLEDAQKVRSQVDRQLGEEPVSDGQRILMWVSAHMPLAAEKILAATRDTYLETVETAAA